MNEISSRRNFTFGWLALGAVSSIICYASTRLFYDDFGIGLTRNLVRVSLLWYSFALICLLSTDVSDRSARTSSWSAARWCWTWAWAFFICHVCAAFHYHHGWSHDHAFENVRRGSGIGEGIYVSYTFIALWTTDVALWWLAPERYTRRSRWIDRCLHGFMLFIVFNSTIVYESGPIRWFGIVGFSALAILWGISKRRPRVCAPANVA